jgi:sec-independent protein translocase protein TatB
MPSIGPLEILVCLVVALIVFGPTRLPEIARTVGKALAELKQQASDLRSEFDMGMTLDDQDVDEAGLDDPALDDADGSEIPAVARTAGGPIVHQGTTIPEITAAEPGAPESAVPSDRSPADSPAPGTAPSGPSDRGTGASEEPGPNDLW